MLRTAHLQQLLSGRLRRGSDYVVLVNADYPEKLSRLAVDEHLPVLAAPTGWVAAHLLGGEKPEPVGQTAREELARLEQIAERRPVVLVSSVELYGEYLRELTGKRESARRPRASVPTARELLESVRGRADLLPFPTKDQIEARVTRRAESVAAAAPAADQRPAVEIPAAEPLTVSLEPAADARDAAEAARGSEVVRKVSRARATSGAAATRRRRPAVASSAAPKPGTARAASPARPVVQSPLLSILDRLDDGFEELREAVAAIAAALGQPGK